MHRSAALSSCVVLLTLGLAPAEAETLGSWTLVVENDLVENTDRQYTNGVRFGYSPPPQTTPAWLERIARWTRAFPAGAAYRSTFSFGQNMYTPDDITVAEPDPADRPYAGWLYASAGLVGIDRNRLHSFDISIGVIGPASLAGETQAWWHSVIGADDPKGWDFQLKNEPAFVASYQRRWNIWRRGFGLVEAAVAPHVGASVGNVFTYANGGLSLRLGHNLGRDFGPPRIQPSIPGSSWIAAEGWSWHVFASAEGRAVARNIFLDGNTFADSRRVDRRSLVGDAQMGFVVGNEAFRLAYTHVFRTDEFRRQEANSGFGAFSLTVRY